MRTRTSKEEELLRLVQELADEYDRIVEPIYPRVFIRVLPRELRYGHIILPEHKQNKVQWEAVVLATYKPFWKIEREVDEIESARSGQFAVLQNSGVVRTEIRPSVAVGDHIVFPYHVGLPDPVFDEKKYRLISENDITAVLTYPAEKPREWVVGQMRQLGGFYAGVDGLSREDFVERLFAEYDLVRRDVTSKTRSGV